LNWA
ncbi:methyltransferase small domain N-terminal family protein, partial [Vibrio parahaemolyticus V-223/04]